jgi:deoxyribonuclease V
MVQRRLAELYEPEGIGAKEVAATVALDVSYSRDRAYAAAVVYDVGRDTVVEVQSQDYGVHFPYVPGYLYMREAPALLRILTLVESPYDLILVDAHGRLHPRRAGLATIVGVLAGKPTMGIAKSLLTGSVGGNGKVRPVSIDGTVEGWYVKAEKEFFASPGNMMSLDEIRKWIRIRKFSYPKELLEADAQSKKLRVISEAGRPS